ncbi:GNAT family N-acetyltransferase [Actinophytocola gossypii]|uniref:GNAT family N-acetyltransferase n=1 Tax=Actinophytocola gossypii TaxID=2812003 RepID=A0ABT2J9P9_9PSEU|nr:GNAT family N-acetyltransferase [Actinophytocola gossypii]MCT2584595.1 GNAT family N-acetyltransferase [Actinophytocola gossypii]
MTISIRAARLPDDQPGIVAIDREFTTDAVYEVAYEQDRFTLMHTPVYPSVTKQFPLDDLADENPPWEFAAVAVDGDEVRGFLGANHQLWNRRLVIWHLYVDIPLRGRGIGRALIEASFDWGRSVGAEVAWLETSNINVPAVTAYRRMGFELCGLDTTLYHGTPDAGEIGLYLARTLY